MIHNENNVYILGAGFSVEHNAPVVKYFMNRIRDYYGFLLRANIPAKKKSADDVAAIMKFRFDMSAAAERANIDLENIEQLFSLAEFTDERDMSKAIRRVIASTLDHTIHGFRVERLVQIQSAERRDSISGWKFQGAYRDSALDMDLNGYAIPPYHAFCGLMAGAFSQPSNSRRNTIITMNYDTVVEDSLRAMKINADTFVNLANQVQRYSSNQTVSILKLHGSMNWTLDEKDNTIHEYPNYSLLENEDGVPFLVPPTWKKAIPEQLANAWKQARLAIESATRIFIIGYSLPQTDQHFRYLLTAGLARNVSLRKIIIVNPDLEIASRVNNMLRAELADAGILGFLHVTTSQFFLHPEFNRIARVALSSTFAPASTEFDSRIVNPVTNSQFASIWE